MDQNLEQRVQDLERQLTAFLSEYSRNSGPSSDIVTKKTIFNNGIDGGTNGLTIGSSADSLVGFYGVSPVPQDTNVISPSGGATVDSQCRNSLNNLIIALQNIGIIA